MLAPEQIARTDLRPRGTGRNSAEKVRNMVVPDMGHAREVADDHFETPERILWVRCIRQALLDLDCVERKGDGINHQLAAAIRAESRRWLDSESVQPASFAWLCDMLGLDAKLLRARSQSKDGRKSLLYMAAKRRERQCND